MAKNKAVVLEARAALNQFKLEISNELGLSKELTSRKNRYDSGYMVKKLIEISKET
ncbi:alpha/beta-type small acid-soluble spore protein [Crassaminicella indica]|uniref:Alpha/beta-type small acid-soluble spore protein n=1 Tax=Crassaminicella indica TaxID=2855394 RepID=A0ABX8R7S0_9CLOT|nr:alpha/beta-type small acid-soluble spore protein [Crassaminicella indica]QXM05089.1 alpha/beta-type small acid-soluble spore protein [Crassaminicella indica]